MEDYFEEIERQADQAIQIANTAKQNGGDPKREAEIPVARDLADRVENLLGIPGLSDRIRELEESNLSREDSALKLAEEFADEEIQSYESRDETVDAAVRTAVALLTEGVVAAPIEGIDYVGTNEEEGFLEIEYAGPVRSAGGTAQAISVLIGDYLRSSLGIPSYEASRDEVERIVEEVKLYDEEVGLQYSPSDYEVRLVIENCPVFLDGEPTSKREVSGYRNMDRIDTNRARGGMCLVLAEGIIQKAPKLQKHVEALDLEGWDWLDELIEKDEPEKDPDKDEAQSKTSDKYLKDLTAGRPVFSHPSRAGGFRLRYGRARNTGHAAMGVSPSTMVILDDFLAAGTQIKTELPGKAAGVAPVDELEGPTVKLRNGEVTRIDTVERAVEIQNSVVEILDLGEVSVNYGEFVENNHPLVTASFTYEWWVQELGESDADVAELTKAFDLREPGYRQAVRLSEKYGVPLHPRYTYMWHDISLDNYHALSESANEAELVDNAVELPFEVSGVLEDLLVPHLQRDSDVVVRDEDVHALMDSLDTEVDSEDVIECVSEALGVEVYPRAPTRIGARMGRPEKAKEREMSPSVHCLYPIGEAGGSQRDISKAVSHTDEMNSVVGEIEVEIGIRECVECGEKTHKPRCECGGEAEPLRRCYNCDIEVDRDECPRCGNETTSVDRKRINVKNEYREALDNLDERSSYDILKCVKGLISENKTPEPLEKGILRAKHGVSIFRDGTIRYDMSDLPLTSFYPREIDTSVEELRSLGYTHDIEGNELTDPDQLVEIKTQDLVINRKAGTYLRQVALFINDLLVKYYDQDPYYEIDSHKDLVGELVIGLAPHTSAGVLGRVIGFTDASAGYAHPFFHAAKRRNCDGDEDSVMLLMDGLLNFSREYLPDRRGGKMDAPLVLTTVIDPNEIDDEAHNIDKVERYPVEFYRKTLQNSDPEDVDIKLAGDDLGTPDALKGFKHTLSSHDISDGPLNSAYKELGNMVEKAESQLEIGRKTRAVDERDVGYRVLDSHFMRDLIGNLRAFSQQQVRCTNCNSKYRRPPLSNQCDCGGNITLTVHEGSVRKYLDFSLKVVEKYDLPVYTEQRLEQLKREIDNVFEDDTAQQSGIADFM